MGNRHPLSPNPVFVCQLPLHASISVTTASFCLYCANRCSFFQQLGQYRIIFCHNLQLISTKAPPMGFISGEAPLSHSLDIRIWFILCPMTVWLSYEYIKMYFNLWCYVNFHALISLAFFFFSFFFFAILFLQITHKKQFCSYQTF